MEILKKMTHLRRLSAAIILAVGLWVGLLGQCTAATSTVSTSVPTDSNGYSQYKILNDSSGNLHTVYYKTVSSYRQIIYAKSTDGGANWVETQLTSGNYDNYYPSIAIDSSNNLYVAWTGTYADSATNKQLRFIKYTGSWSAIETLTSDTSYNQYSPSIGVDSANKVHIVWKGMYAASPATYQVRYIKYDGSWSSITNLTTDTNYAQTEPVLSIDSLDNLHVAWLAQHSGSTVKKQLRYVKYSGSWGSIQNLTSGGTYDQGGYIGMAIDSNNYVHIAWSGQYSGSSAQNVRYIKYDGSWSAVQDLSAESYSVQGLSISCNGSDINILFAQRHTGSTTYNQIRRLLYNGSWQSIENLTSAAAHQYWPQAMRTNAGLAYIWIDGGTLKFYSSEDFEYYNPFEPAEISITYPSSSSTSKAEFWTVDANTNDDVTYDKLYVKVRSASTQTCAENTACSSAWVDGNRVIGECDGTNSTFDNTSNVSRLAQIPDTMAGETIYATAFLYGVTDATCVDGEGPELPVLLATSATVSFTYSTDYITDLSDADEYWAASWADRWGAATSTMSYQAVAGGFDLIMAPVVNWASGWSHLFNTADATEAGISAGSGIQVLMQHAKDFFNVIPGCQLFAILLIAIIIDIAIYIYKNIYRIKKFFTV